MNPAYAGNSAGNGQQWKFCRFGKMQANTNAPGPDVDSLSLGEIVNQRTTDQQRRTFLKQSGLTAASALLAPGLGSTGSANQPENQRPNLLFVLADQWRFSSFGHGTDPLVRTPNFDRLTEEGALLNRAYAANPVCTPNRSCILTGRYSHETGMIKNDIMLPPAEICWPEIFRDAGYTTHYVGKWHMDGDPKPGFVPPGWRRRGFETFEGFNRGHVYHEHWGFDNEGGPLAALAKDYDDPYYEPTLQTDLAIDFMKRSSDSPFACYLSWGPPHTPFRPPKTFDLYKSGEMELRPNVPRRHRKQAVKDLVGYYGLCESLDHEMGRLMSYLEESGLAENTLVVFTADHGELAGSHGKYRKGEPEDESLHVPLIMRLPGRIAAGQQVDTLFNSIDLMPTLLATCGLKDPGTCTGRDLSGALLEGEPSPSVDSVYCEGKLTAAPPNKKNAPNNANAGSWRSLVTDRYKLVVRADENRVVQLFDLQNDPYEMENLANQAAVQGELLTELRDWGKRTNDSFPAVPNKAKVLYSDEEAAAARS